MVPSCQLSRPHPHCLPGLAAADPAVHPATIMKASADLAMSEARRVQTSTEHLDALTIHAKTLHPQGRVEARLLHRIKVAWCHAGKCTSCLKMLSISWLRSGHHSQVLCAALHAWNTTATCWWAQQLRVTGHQGCWAGAEQAVLSDRAMTALSSNTCQATNRLAGLDHST